VSATWNLQLPTRNGDSSVEVIPLPNVSQWLKFIGVHNCLVSRLPFIINFLILIGIANCILLYGLDVDVFILCDNATKFQAIAIKVGPENGSWTNFLHTEIDPLSTSDDAVLSLLQTTEVEVAKFFFYNWI
jgi:hypothetical protein